MPIKPMTFDKEYTMFQLNNLLKEGYCSIKAMPTWLRNDYRELSLQKAIDIVNEWIDEYKIKHEHLVILSSKKQDFVLTETEYNKTMAMLKQLQSIRRNRV